MRRLTTQADADDARRSILELLDARDLWLCTEGRARAPFELCRGAWELRRSPTGARALLFAYDGASGSRVWRVTGWETRGETLLLDVAGRLGAVRATLELRPRATAAEGREAITAARLALCWRLAERVCAAWPGGRVEWARLSAGARRGEPGRYARALLRRGRERLAVTGPVVALGPADSDAFVASALLWFLRLSPSKGLGPPRRLRLVAARTLAEAAAERAALLRADLRTSIEVFATAEGVAEHEPVRVPELCELLAQAPRLTLPRVEGLSETAAAVGALAPEAIDVVRARRGETLRFRGLTFARVRRVAGREMAWFGVGEARRRRVLDERSWPELLRLVAELSEHRRADSSVRSHALFRAAPEAWLESLLRRDVTRLDPGLRLAPVHAQFSPARPKAGAAARPVDLLALRRDGRLVVIELKVSESAALPLQAADYWRRLAAQHAAGHVRRARLFGDAEISDDPPLVYAVAPLLRFHRSFQTLARCLSPSIELYRYDLNEDWRSGVRVARRVRVE